MVRHTSSKMSVEVFAHLSRVLFFPRAHVTATRLSSYDRFFLKTNLEKEEIAVYDDLGRRLRAISRSFDILPKLPTLWQPKLTHVSLLFLCACSATVALCLLERHARLPGASAPRRPADMLNTMAISHSRHNTVIYFSSFFFPPGRLSQ